MHFKSSISLYLSFGISMNHSSYWQTYQRAV